MNRIILESDALGSFEVAIQEDFQLETISEFTSFAALCPTIDSLTTFANAATSTGGKVSKGGLALQSLIDSPRWSKTNPVKITTSMFFYTQDDARSDVVDRMNILYGLHLLRRSNDNKILIPGINAKIIKQLDKAIAGKGDEGKAFKKLKKTDQDTLNALKNSSEAAFFAVTIPGVVFLPSAFLFQITPTYSKHITEDGFPLWAQADVVIQGLAPAFVEDFVKGAGMHFKNW